MSVSGGPGQQIFVLSTCQSKYLAEKNTLHTFSHFAMIGDVFEISPSINARCLDVSLVDFDYLTCNE